MKVLYVVAARGGSKGVPRKNIAVVGELPLIAYKIIAAKKSRFDKRIIVSTDDPEIAEVAKQYDAEVPFMRPGYLATATAGSMDVVEHAMNWVEEHDDRTYDHVCLLEPSSPFLSFEDLNRALAEMEKRDADTMVSVTEADVSSRFIFELDENGSLASYYRSVRERKSVRRQDQPVEYTLNGCLYVAKWDYFRRNKLFHSENSFAYIMPKTQSVEVDEPLDLLVARTVAENGFIDLSLWK